MALVSSNFFVPHPPSKRPNLIPPSPMGTEPVTHAHVTTERASEAEIFSISMDEIFDVALFPSHFAASLFATEVVYYVPSSSARGWRCVSSTTFKLELEL